MSSMACSHDDWAFDVYVGYCECEPKRAYHWGAFCFECQSRADAYLRESEVPENVDRHDLDTIVKLVNERLARERGDARPLASAIAKKTRRAKTPRGAKKIPASA